MGDFEILSIENLKAEHEGSLLFRVSGKAKAKEWELLKFLAQQIKDKKTSCDSRLLTAAKLCAREGQVDMVKIFEQFFQDQEQNGHFRCECAIAACSSLQESVVAYLDLKPDWLFQFSPILNFATHMAIQGKNTLLCRTLFNMQPAQIIQLLRLSISQGHVALSLTLINYERFSTKDVDMPDSSGATALMLAADAGHHELIEGLLERGASVRAEDSQGRTALSRACEAGHARAAKTLLDRGADASHRDRQGRTCADLAQLNGHIQVLRLDEISAKSPNENLQLTRLSEELHQLLCDAGFTQERARCQHRLADFLEALARHLTQEDRRMTGSYAEGWANSLVQVNGRIASDSDIDFTVLINIPSLHLEGGCFGLQGDCKYSEHLPVTEGHAQVPVGSGSQPANAVKACGVRPSEDTCPAIPCCSQFCVERISKLTNSFSKVHLVRATRPKSKNELRVSFSFQERAIMRQLNRVQGQLFTVIKFVFKRLLPLIMDAPGLKTYHAKTLLFFMLDRHGTGNMDTWDQKNLLMLLKEAFDMMLEFLDSSESPDVCMPHFFMPDAPLYFKNAGIGGDFNNTKVRVKNRLRELRSDISFVVEHLKKILKPLQSVCFYFHPFTLLPLTTLTETTVFNIGETDPRKYAYIYFMVQQCIMDLQSNSSTLDAVLKTLEQLDQLQCCRFTALSLKAIAYIKFQNQHEAHCLLKKVKHCTVKRGLSPEEIKQFRTLDADWAWRFCFRCDATPRFPFLPEFTQTLFTARLSQPRSAHLYVNFRCLSWSLQAELLGNTETPIVFDAWLAELREDPDLEELFTLAHYSDRSEHLEFCLRNMKIIREERRVSMETQDEEKISWVNKKLNDIIDDKNYKGKSDAATYMHSTKVHTLSQTKLSKEASSDNDMRYGMDEPEAPGVMNRSDRPMPQILTESKTRNSCIKLRSDMNESIKPSIPSLSQKDSCFETDTYTVEKVHGCTQMRTHSTAGKISYIYTGTPDPYPRDSGVISSAYTYGDRDRCRRPLPTIQAVSCSPSHSDTDSTARDKLSASAFCPTGKLVSISNPSDETVPPGPSMRRISGKEDENTCSKTYSCVDLTAASLSHDTENPYETPITELKIRKLKPLKPLRQLLRTKRLFARSAQLEDPSSGQQDAGVRHPCAQSCVDLQAQNSDSESYIYDEPGMIDDIRSNTAALDRNLSRRMNDTRKHRSKLSRLNPVKAINKLLGKHSKASAASTSNVQNRNSSAIDLDDCSYLTADRLGVESSEAETDIYHEIVADEVVRDNCTYEEYDTP